jgi:GR25 family glycosyltransferase involved in LPS biosynthesis
MNTPAESEVAIFCLSHNSTVLRRTRIANIFAKQGLVKLVRFYDGVDAKTDPRITGRDLDENTARCWSIMYGHLDMLRLFAESNKEFGIFCEDDIIVRNDFTTHLTSIVAHFKELQLDVLLLGNICSNPDFRYCSNFPELHITHDTASYPFHYYAYDSNPESAVWGTQMYMLHKHQAKYLLHKYSTEYADRALRDSGITPFSADWTITKEGTKATIYPLVAIENYELAYEDLGQNECRKKNFLIFYSEELFG